MLVFSRSLAVLALVLALATPPAIAQRNPNRPRRTPQNPQTPTAQGQPTGFRGGGGGTGVHQPPKPYADVVTKDAKTQEGVFKVHRIKEQVLFEIPKSMLGRDFLMSVQLIRTPPGLGGLLAAGMPTAQQVLRFEKRDDVILMRAPQYSVRVKNDAGLTYGLERSTVEPIVNSFDVMAYGPDGAPVIDVTKLYISDAGDLATGSRIGGSAIDASRSYIEEVQAFPTNVEVESQLTFQSGGGGGGFGRGGGGGSPSRSAVTAWVHYSLLELPDKPMQPRLKDSRIGYFSTFFTEYDGNKHQDEQVGYIDRFRLEKKDPSAAISDPVKPIVFYVQRDVPDKWRPYIHQAVEAWNACFLKAGFSNAIEARDEPTPDQDPNFHAGDLRYSLISWSPSTTENAEGLHIADPRSGETLYAHVLIWHDVLKLAQNWYFVQASPNDPSAQKLPLSDAKMGQLIRYVVTHEVGHCLGLEHNFKASSAYTTANLRSPSFTARYGDEASIMDYGRFNYVAQPGDHAHLIPILGPYDYFAIQYGYMPAMASSAEGEKSQLDHFLAQQIHDPKVRFGNSDGNDPGMETEDMGSNPIESTTLGLKNLDRVLTYLIPACDKYGEDYTVLRDMYRQTLSQRSMELNHVTKLVGGIYDNDNHVGRGGPVYVPVPKSEQAAAVHLLVTKGLNLPANYYNPRILNRIQGDGYLDLAGSAQQILLMSLLAETRAQRILDNEAANGANSYSLSRLIGDVQGAVFDELHGRVTTIPLQRRTLQLRYLEVMDSRLNGAGGSKSEFRTIARYDLHALYAAIGEKMDQSHDTMTRAHLLACRDRIKEILSGKMGDGSNSAGSAASFLLGYDQPAFEGIRPRIEGVTDQPGFMPPPEE